MHVNYVRTGRRKAVHVRSEHPTDAGATGEQPYVCKRNARHKNAAGLQTWVVYHQKFIKSL